MRASSPPWPVTLSVGVLIGALAVSLAWAYTDHARAPGRLVDMGPAEAFTATGDFPPVLNARDGFYLVRTAVGELRALYAYPATAQLHDRPGCAVAWFASLPPTPWMNVFRDPCFGDTFSRDGGYLAGPASRSLDQFAVAVKDGRVMVDTRRLLCNGPGPCHRLR